jgi:hypothetical protein
MRLSMLIFPHVPALLLPACRFAAKARLPVSCKNGFVFFRE